MREHVASERPHPARGNGQAPYRFELKSAGEVMRAQRVAWLVCDAIPAQGLAVLYGAPGSGKSFVALDFARAVSGGRPWLGRRTRRALVVYVVLEGTIADRLAALKDYHALDDADLEGMRFLNDVRLNLRAAEDVDRLITDLALQLERGGADTAIVIDTLARAIPGANENSSEDMGAAIEACARIQHELGALVMLVHHAGKDATRGSRGWSGLLGAVDAELLCERNGEGPSATRSLTLTKVKDGTDGLTYGFTLERIDIGPRSDVDVDAAPDERRTSCAVAWKEGTTSRAAGKAVGLGKNQRLLLTALRDGPMIRTEAVRFLRKAGASKAGAYDAIAGLLATGVIEDTAVGLREKT